MTKIQKYIIIDDDPFNNMICKLAITNTLDNVNVSTFEIPEDGLAFIQQEYNTKPELTVIFLDINMPMLTGWEFMEYFEKFSEEIKGQSTIYFVSSSVDPRDIRRAKENKYIKGFISKPLNREKILSIANNLA